MKSTIQNLLTRALEPGADFVAVFDELGAVRVTDYDDALALCAALEQLPDPAPGALPGRTPLDVILGLFQSVETEVAYDAVLREGLPKLSEILSERLNAPILEPDPAQRASTMFGIKILGLFGGFHTPDLLARAAQLPVWSDEPLWLRVLSIGGESYTSWSRVLEKLRNPLPRGLAGLAYLEFANALARANEGMQHPFDTQEGRNRLAEFLQEQEPKHAPFKAKNAAEALVHLQSVETRELIRLALEHQSPIVQFEGACASARLGEQEGINLLSRFSLDLNLSIRARMVLQELELHHSVPDRASEPNFEAMAKLVDWLSDPEELGAPPDRISMLDSRELLWPPSSDLEKLWLFRFSYENHPYGGPGFEGVGLVGSITFCLFGETNPSMSPEDIYALHCCLELQIDDDPRAPEKRTVDAGRRLLGFPS